MYIAVAGPLNDASMKGNPLSSLGNANGRDMLNGIELCFEDMRRQGKLKDIKIKLVPYKESDKKDALKNASKIVEENKALVVIGHYTNSGSLAAGAIYRNNGIPAITASAADEAVTEGNEWYFKIMPDRRFTRAFLAYTVRHLLQKDTASIIFDKNSYGSTIVQDFEEKAEKTGIKIAHKWFFNSEDEDVEHQMRSIVGKLRAVRTSGIILCALYARDADNLFTSLRYPGTDFQIVGPNSFSSPSFIKQFDEYPHEKENPGYYTDGIYAVSPFISYLADSPHVAEFRKKNIDRYGSEPSWVTANYYDAALLVANALERAEIQGEDIRKDRRKFRKALGSFNEPNNAVQGVTGNLYFDQERNVPRSLQFGVWKKHQFLPAYFQYKATETKKESKLVAGKKVSVKKDTKGQEVSEIKKEAVKTLEIAGQQLEMYRVVYAGVDINKISNIDPKRGIFTADFYIWFRYSGSFDDNNIVFPDATSPVVLEPVNGKKTTPDGATLRMYRVSASFRADFNLNFFPLDRHKLRIRFHHQKEGRERLLYVPDVEGLPFLVEKNDQGRSMVSPIQGWDTKDISCLQKIVPESLHAAGEVVYSALDTEIEVQRHDRAFFLGKTLAPLFFMLVALYFIFFHPGNNDMSRLCILLVAVALIAWVRLVYASSLPGQDFIRDMSSILSLAVGASALTATALFFLRRYEKNTPRTERYLLYAGQVLYITVTLGGTAWHIIGILGGTTWLLYTACPLLVS